MGNWHREQRRLRRITEKQEANRPAPAPEPPLPARKRVKATAAKAVRQEKVKPAVTAKPKVSKYARMQANKKKKGA